MKKLKRRRGLYILTSSIMDQTETIKLGMSMCLENRWSHYTNIFPDTRYLSCYVFDDEYSKYDILFIEAIILSTTIDFKNSPAYATEYRKMTYNNLHKIVVQTLDKYKIKYKFEINPKYTIISDTSTHTKDITSDDQINKIIAHIPDKIKRDMAISNQLTKYEALWQHQKDNIEIIINKLKTKEYFQGVCSLATGLGKSYIMYYVCLKHLELYPNDNIMWICFRNDIIDSQLKMFNQNPNIFKVCNHGTLNWKNLKNIKGKVVVVLRQSLDTNKMIQNMFHGILYDECHDASKISTTNQNDKVVDGITYETLKWIHDNNKLKYRIGFSATPLTNDDKQNMGMIDLYGNKETSEINYLYQMTLMDGVRAGLLVKPRIKYRTYDIGKYNINDFYKFIDTSTESDDVIKTKYYRIIRRIKKDIKMTITKMIYKKGLLWFPSKRVQEFMFRIIKIDGIDIYYSNSDYDKDDIIFREREENCLMFACDKFKIGFDAINMEFGMNFVLNESGQAIIQKLGRFTRNNKPLQNIAYLYQMTVEGDDSDTLIMSIIKNIRILGINISDIKLTTNSDDLDHQIAEKNDHILEDIIFDVQSKTLDWNTFIKRLEMKKLDLDTRELSMWPKWIKIITEYKKTRLIETKEDYFSLCNDNDVLPKNPEIYGGFMGWIDYLSIDRSLYEQDEKLTMKRIAELIKEKNINKNNSLTKIYSECREYDPKLPPLPMEFYADRGIRSIGDLVKINLIHKKQRL